MKGLGSRIVRRVIDGNTRLRGLKNTDSLGWPNQADAIEDLRRGDIVGHIAGYAAGLNLTGYSNQSMLRVGAI
jgi:hypothetical protein